jgi:uncharacterized repeat protein (TIGR01451 family)
VALFDVGTPSYGDPGAEGRRIRQEEVMSIKNRAPRSAPRLIGSIAAFAAVALVAAGVASAAPGPTDLALTKTDSADPVVQGSNLTYTLKVDNLGVGGTSDATDVTVTDTLPSQVDYVSSSSPDGTCQRSGPTVTCDFGTVNAGASVTATIVVKTKKSGTISNTATVATTVIDGVAANNQDTETTVVSKPSKANKPKGQSCAAPTITGTPGNDSITGTKGNDVIVTGAGNDRVFALGGKDLVCTNGGADLISGGDKDDTLIGGGGPDRLFGNAGKDALRGKSGRDRLRGNSGNDVLNGGKARDNCRGGSGADVLRRCP